MPLASDRAHHQQTHGFGRCTRPVSACGFDSADATPGVTPRANRQCGQKGNASHGTPFADLLAENEIKMRQALMSTGRVRPLATGRVAPQDILTSESQADKEFTCPSDVESFEQRMDHNLRANMWIYETAPKNTHAVNHWREGIGRKQQDLKLVQTVFRRLRKTDANSPFQAFLNARYTKNLYSAVSCLPVDQRGRRRKSSFSEESSSEDGVEHVTDEFKDIFQKTKTMLADHSEIQVAHHRRQCVRKDSDEDKTLDTLVEEKSSSRASSAHSSRVSVHSATSRSPLPSPTSPCTHRKEHTRPSSANLTRANIASRCARASFETRAARANVASRRITAARLSRFTIASRCEGNIFWATMMIQMR
jgi:hypothetical protein